MASSPPPYPPSASVSRTRTSQNSVRSAAESLLRLSLARGSAASSTSGGALPPYTFISDSIVQESPTSPTPIVTTPHASVGGGESSASAAAARAALASAMLIPSSGPFRSATTTSKTRERLRLVELERDELQAKVSEVGRIAAEEHAQVERLKREGDVAGISATEAKLRVRQLKRDAEAARTKSLPTSGGIFKIACSTDLLFLVDTTSSMSGHIAAAKQQVRSIVKDIRTAFLNMAEVRVAVVGYKDHAESANIEFLDFTPSVDRVYAFLDGLSATGGGDTPEDVLGGVNKALNASWQQQTRCIIHIADAPPHGYIFCDETQSDDYSTPGSEPHGLTYEPLFKRMVGLNINYVLLRINDITDRMALLFSQVYGEADADCKLHVSNRHRTSADRKSSLRAGTSTRTVQARLMFVEEALGTSYSELQRLVVKSVRSSASRTAARVSGATRTGKAGATKVPGMDLTTIKEDHAGTDDTVLETFVPQWDRPGWFNETLRVEGFSPDVVVHSASTLNEMMAHDDNIRMSITELTIHKRSRPFAQGAMRVAAYARTAASTNRFVIKWFKQGDKQLAHLAEDMRCQALCKAFALEFNALTGEYSIDFIVTTCLKGKAGTAAGDDCISLEPFIEGTYIKYNNNSGYVNEDIRDDRFNQAAQAFSHFTFERSSGRFLVSDLQGAGHVLTDPAIHTRDPERFKLTDTNLGEDGFKLFFVTHVCNAACRKLGLKSNAAMLMPGGRLDFRDSWPRMDNTVCCSNKLCGKIIQLSHAKKSDTFPGRHWCDICYPQLHATNVKWLCIASGPPHEFDGSKFFYESQGRIVPRKCFRHRDDHETMSRPIVFGGNFWSRLNFAKKKNSSSEKSS